MNILTSLSTLPWISVTIMDGPCYDLCPLLESHFHCLWWITRGEYRHGTPDRRLLGSQVRRRRSPPGAARAHLRTLPISPAVDGVVQIQRGECLREAAPPRAAARLEAEPQVHTPAQLVEVVARHAHRLPRPRRAAPFPRLFPPRVGRPRLLLPQPRGPAATATALRVRHWARLPPPPPTAP